MTLWGFNEVLMLINSLRAEFLSRNITEYQQFLPFLYINNTQVEGILFM